MGNCKVMPFQVYQRKRSQPQVENPTSGQAASSAEASLPPINTTTMTEDLTHVLERDDGINHPVPTSHSLGQTFGSAKKSYTLPRVCLILDLLATTTGDASA